MVNYALKKLIKSGLSRAANREELLYAKSEMVRKLCLCYSREICLVNTFSELGEVDAEYLADLVRQLRVLSGLCRQAAGSAINYSWGQVR